MDDQIDLSLLQRFFSLSQEGAEYPFFEVPAMDLLQPEHMEEALKVCKHYLKAYQLDLPASFLGLSYFYIGAAVQTCLSLYNQVIDYSLPNFILQLKDQGNYIQVIFKMKNISTVSLHPSNRKEQVKRSLSEVYQNNILPLVQVTASQAEIKPDLIWAQYGARMTYVHDILLKQELRKEIKLRITDDQELLMALPPEVFNRKRNPFMYRPRYADNPWQPGEPMLIRSSCCLYYNREGGDFCYNCPKLSRKERERRKETIEQNLKASTKGKG